VSKSHPRTKGNRLTPGSKTTEIMTRNRRCRSVLRVYDVGWRGRTVDRSKVQTKMASQSELAMNATRKRRWLEMESHVNWRLDFWNTSHNLTLSCVEINSAIAQLGRLLSRTMDLWLNKNARSFRLPYSIRSNSNSRSARYGRFAHS